MWFAALRQQVYLFTANSTQITTNHTSHLVYYRLLLKLCQLQYLFIFVSRAHKCAITGTRHRAHIVLCWNSITIISSLVATNYVMSRCDRWGVIHDLLTFSYLDGNVSRKGVKFAYDNIFATHPFFTHHRQIWRIKQPHRP